MSVDLQEQEPPMKKLKKMVTKKERQPRAKNYSVGEIEVLKDGVKTHWNVVNGKHSNGVTKHLQDMTWAKIATTVSALGVTLRDGEGVKEKWRKLTQAAKTEVAAQTKVMDKTGHGGPPPEISDPILADVADMFADSSSFHGIKGALDAETITFPYADVDSDIDYEGLEDLPRQDEEDNSVHTVPELQRTPDVMPIASEVQIPQVQTVPQLQLSGSNTRTGENNHKLIF